MYIYIYICIYQKHNVYVYIYIHIYTHMRHGQNMVVMVYGHRSMGILLSISPWIDEHRPGKPSPMI